MKATPNLPAVSGTPAPPRKKRPTRPRKTTGVKAGNPRPARTRPVPWDPEPIFHACVAEMHFNPEEAKPV